MPRAAAGAVCGGIWRFRSGAQGRELPAEFGSWPTVHGRFRGWRDAGSSPCR
ncbi:transposase [Streptomyces sp. MMG1533]|uniref:transposase n=1 Tax=Streptomyces sp. MMG1533 TaxID=1415546 RepID=UPI00131E44FA